MLQSHFLRSKHLKTTVSFSVTHIIYTADHGSISSQTGSLLHHHHHLVIAHLKDLKVASAMPELPDDHVDSIKEGTLAYWMSQDEDVPRGSIGEVLELDGEDCVVQFPKKQLKISAAKLNVSDFQKGTYVHLTDDGLSDEMLGEVKGLSGEEDGKLLIEIEGEEKHVKPKYLFKCDLQVGIFAFWKKSDDDIPSGHLGQVLADLNEKGKVKVKFPNGSWRFRPKDLVKSHVQPGSYVQWTSSDDDIAVGEIGEATGQRRKNHKNSDLLRMEWS